MRCVVVGAGIMGLCTAWALRRGGHDIVILEQGDVPNPLGSSVDRHRLIRYPYGAMTGYASLIDAAFSAWGRLWDDLGERHYIETGCLGLSSAENDWTAQSCDTMDRLGHSYRTLTPREVEHKYPHLNTEGVVSAFETDTGGPLLADRIVGGLADWLRAQRVKVRTHTTVRVVDTAAAAVTLDDGSRVDGDALVITAGPWVARIVPAFEGRTTPSRQVVIYISAPPDIQAAWERTPVLIDLGVDAGFYTVPAVRGYPMKIGDHTFSLTGNPDQDRVAGDDEAARIFASAGVRFRGLDRCRIAEAKTCFYTVTLDERFLLENDGATWIAGGFSGHGFKFGALIGEAIRDGIEGRRTPQDLQTWAAGRIAAS